jgi:hypothetical protein
MRRSGSTYKIPELLQPLMNWGNQAGCLEKRPIFETPLRHHEPRRMAPNEGGSRTPGCLVYSILFREGLLLSRPFEMPAGAP